MESNYGVERLEWWSYDEVRSLAKRLSPEPSAVFAHF